jgi:hypothetical protein
MCKKYNITSQATDDNMAQALWMLHNTKAANTHSEYVILIAFPTARIVIATRLNIIYEKTRNKT